MKEEVIDLVEVEEVEKDIEKRIKTTGIKGLDFEAAKRLGIFQRISYLLCTMHASIVAANRIYGHVDNIFGELKAKRNEIKRETTLFEKAFDRFISFWTQYYAHGVAGSEVIFETERLYKQIMRWCQIPEDWQFGDPQRIEDDVDLAIRINSDEKVYTLRNSEFGFETLDCNESWGVLKYDVVENKTVTVEDKMDKASAIMVAKRLSAEDKDNIYTAVIVSDIVEKKIRVSPFKAFRDNETIGSIIKNFK